MSVSIQSWIAGRGPQALADRIVIELGGVQTLAPEQQGGEFCVFVNSRIASYEADLYALMGLSRQFSCRDLAWIVHCSDKGEAGAIDDLFIRDGEVHLRLSRSALNRSPTPESLSLEFEAAGLERLILKPDALVPPVFAQEDWMKRALALARRGLGRVAPNPSVGCVLVHGRHLIGEGATQSGGRPHAEEAALRDAGSAAVGATAFVTLEPCSTRSSDQPGCARRLAHAGVRQVVVACEDPHPLAARGLTLLDDAGVETKLGVLKAEAEALNCGFLKRLKTGRPWLAIDPDPSRYDCLLEPLAGEDPAAALDRLGASGFTRVAISPEAALTISADILDLVDEIVG
jgi:diaminohydroxyphosphoribosylaminopyrimidine deaminase/5-amino-6-(5-phosphoribosylamino)uracil reductase